MLGYAEGWRLRPADVPRGMRLACALGLLAFGPIAVAQTPPASQPTSQPTTQPGLFDLDFDSNSLQSTPPTDDAFRQAAEQLPDQPKRRPDVFLDWLEQDRETGDWWGARQTLADVGLQFDLFYNAFLGANTRGGVSTNGAVKLSGTFDLLLRADFEKMGLIPGGSMLVFAKYGHGANINPYVGALSPPIDDADGNLGIYIDHLHYQQSLFDHVIDLRVGYLDQQLALDQNAYANFEDIQFYSTFLDNNNAIIPLTIGLGATAFIHPVPWLTLTVGAADGGAKPLNAGFNTTFHGPAEFFGYFQTTIHLDIPSPRGPMPGNYRVGTFYDPRTNVVFESFQNPEQPPLLETGDVGWYLSFDQMLYRENPDDLQGLGMFVRYGHRDGSTNQIEDFWSTGFQYEGLIPGRDDDLTGIGIYSALSGEEYRDNVDPEFKGETGVEFYYNIEITPWLHISPDVQYIHNPGGNVLADDSVVLGLRLRMTL